MKQRVLIFTTGGTIEKTYDEQSGILSNKGSQLEKMLSRLRLPYTDIVHRDLLAKDSLDMTDKDRQIIMMALENALDEECPILVMHGTDTMEVTARQCFDRFKGLRYPIVFTGAMIPFGFENSDALQNFTEALLACGMLKAGVYISFHGKIHELPGVRKNRERATFERIETKKG